ncbi:MAG: cupin domain-containing protein [Muribaculaceae bacterium]
MCSRTDCQQGNRRERFRNGHHDGIRQGCRTRTHTAPAVAVVQILEGVCAFTINGEERMLQAGDCLVMQPGTPHSLRAPERFKMLLTRLNA